MTITRINTDSLGYIRLLPDNAVDTIITDPPYDIDAIRMAEYHKEFLRICKGDIIVFLCSIQPMEFSWCPMAFLGKTYEYKKL